MRKILVFGNGFIAKPLIQKLSRDNYEIRVFSKSPKTANGYSFTQGDIFDYEGVKSLFDWNPQIVIHTAWITKPGIYRSDPSNLKYTSSTLWIAELALKNRVENLIILGSCAEYGHQKSPSLAGKTVTLPSSIYAKQKVESFNLVRLMLENSNTRLTWPRIFFPYGLDQDEKRLIPSLISRIRSNSEIILEDISSVYDWISVDDVCSALLYIINNEVPLEVDIGTTSGYTNLEVLIMLENLLQPAERYSQRKWHSFGNDEVLIVDKRSPLFLSGWRPMLNLEAGLRMIASR